MAACPACVILGELGFSQEPHNKREWALVQLILELHQALISCEHNLLLDGVTVPEDAQRLLARLDVLHPERTQLRIEP